MCCVSGREAGGRGVGAAAPAAHAAAVDPDLGARAQPQVGRCGRGGAVLLLAPALQARPARLVRDLRARAQRRVRARCEYRLLTAYINSTNSTRKTDFRNCIELK